MDPSGGQVTTPIDEFGDYAALDPFFRIIEEGLAGFVDGRHFFDLLAEDVIFDYVISVPGYPRRVEGRRAVAERESPGGIRDLLEDTGRRLPA